MADGPPEWVWTKGFKCFQQGVVDHLEEEEERGEQKHLSKGAKLTPKNPTSLTSAKEHFWASGITSQDFQHV